MSDVIARAREVLAAATQHEPMHAYEQSGFGWIANARHVLAMVHAGPKAAHAIVLAMRALPALLALAEALTKHPPICLRRDLCEPVAPDARCPRCRQRAALDRALAALRPCTCERCCGFEL